MNTFYKSNNRRRTFLINTTKDNEIIKPNFNFFAFISDITNTFYNTLKIFFPISLLIGFYYLLQLDKYEDIPFQLISSNVKLLLGFSAIFYIIFLGLSYLMLAPTSFNWLLPKHIIKLIKQEKIISKYFFIRIYLIIQPILFFWLIKNLLSRSPILFSLCINVSIIFIFFCCLKKIKLGSIRETIGFTCYSVFMLIFGVVFLVIFDKLSSNSSYITQLGILSMYFFIQYAILFAHLSHNTMTQSQMFYFMLCEFILFAMVYLSALDTTRIIIEPILYLSNGNHWSSPVQYYVNTEEAQLIDKRLLQSEAGHKYLTVPVCKVIDDGVTTYTKTLDGNNLLLKNENIRIDGAVSKTNNQSEICKKILLHSG